MPKIITRPLTEIKVRQIFQEEFSRAIEVFDFNLQEREEQRDAKMHNFLGTLADQVVTEIKEMRDEHSTIVLQVPEIRSQLEDHETRIEKLEFSLNS